MEFTQSWSLGKVAVLVTVVVRVTVLIRAHVHGYYHHWDLSHVICWVMAEAIVLKSYHVCVQQQISCDICRYPVIP